MSSDFLTAQEAADEMGVHEKTVRRMILRGELPAVRVGRGYKILRDHLPTEQLRRARRRYVPRAYRPSGSAGEIVAEIEATRRMAS